MSKQGPNVATFLKQFIEFTGEVTCLHGRYEVSKAGIVKMRELLGHAMEGLRDKDAPAAPSGARLADPIISPRYAAKELPTNAKGPASWLGYLASDVVALGKRKYSVDFECNEHRVWAVTRDTGKRYLAYGGDDAVCERQFRAYGLRRPDEPDYKPIA